MYLATLDRKTIVGSGVTVKISLFADSMKHVVTGYDAVLKYDPARLRFIEARSTLPDFQIFTKVKEGAVVITGIKALPTPGLTETPTILSDVGLAEISFEPVSQGTVSVDLDYSYGMTHDSNLVDGSAKDILTKVQGLKLYLGNGLTLVAGSETAIDNSTSVKLVEVTGPQEGCADCIEYAKIEVRSGGNLKTIEFKTGGIAGLLEIRDEAFGYIFEVEEFTQGAVRLNTAKK